MQLNSAIVLNTIFIGVVQMSTKHSSRNLRNESIATQLFDSSLNDEKNEKFLDAIYTAYRKSLGKESLSKNHNCSICGTSFEGYGNNPAPVKNEGRACDSCNTTEVMPARIAQLDAGLNPNW
jgi:hypothetical protein